MNAGKSLSFGIWVSQLRKGLDLRQQDLAKCVGCSPSTIKKIEEGDRRPSRQVAELLAECLDIPPHEREAFVRFARAEADIPQAGSYPRPVPRIVTHADDHAPWHTLHYPHPSYLRHPSNLPAQPNVFIGREREMSAAKALLRRPGVRLLTLTGPPGTGKTRLAQQLAAEMLEDFDDGVFFVALASVTTRRLVASAIAQVLDVRESARQLLIDSLKNYLRDKQMLLLLDNFEQALPAVPLVSELMAAARGLKVLVTSRALLHVYGEYEMKVPPLSLPQRKYPPVVERLMGLESVQLFVERALAARPGFALTPENAPSVADICRRLDGLPLAIELAAARIRFYSPQLLLKRLEGTETEGEAESRKPGFPAQARERAEGSEPGLPSADGLLPTAPGAALRLLVGGPHDLPSRQRTLRAAIAWSYDLLHPEEQRLFERISIFVGGFTAEAAHAVLDDGRTRKPYTIEDDGGAPSDAADPIVHRPSSIVAAGPETLDGLLSLMNKSLLRGEPVQDAGADGEMRFSMLETIREYGLEQLAEHERSEGQTEAVRRRHALYYLRLAELAEPEIRGPDQKVWLDRLEIEHDNLRAALLWADEAGVRGEGPDQKAGGRRQEAEGSGGGLPAADGLLPTEVGLRLAAALGWFWFRRGYLSEGREWLNRVLSRSKTMDEQGSLIQSRTMGLRQPLASPPSSIVHRPSSPQAPGHSAKALGAAARLAEHQGDHASARSLYEESRHAYEALGDKQGVAYALRGLGFMFFREGNLDRATQLYEQSLAIFRELRDVRGTATVLRGLGDVALRGGDYGLARSLFAESLDLFQGLNDKYIIAILLTSLGNVALDQGDYASARSLYDRGLGIFRELEDRYGIAGSLLSLAEVARCQEDFNAARRLNEESLAIWRVVGEKWNMAMTLHNMGHAIFHLGDLERARVAFVDSLNIFRETGANVGIAMCMAGLGGVAAARGQAARAAGLFGSADALLKASGTLLQAADLSDYERNVAATRAQLGETAFRAAWAVGQTTPIPEAIANALALAEF